LIQNANYDFILTLVLISYVISYCRIAACDNTPTYVVSTYVVPNLTTFTLRPSS